MASALAVVPSPWCYAEFYHPKGPRYRDSRFGGASSTGAQGSQSQHYPLFLSGR
jgi:hypothetical protein